MAAKKKATGNLLISGFSLLVGLACPVLLAQTQDAKPVSKASEPALQTCDSSFSNPVPGESIADAARRNRAWKNCVEEMKSAAQRVVEHLVKKVQVENGHLTVGALLPGLATSPGFLVNRLDIYVRNRSPIKHEYTLTARCGTWSQTRSGSVGPSGRGGPEEDLGKPSFSFDVSPPCDFMDVALDVASPDEIKGLQQTSASAVPGVSEEEMAQRLRSLQGSKPVQTKADMPTAHQPGLPDLSVSPNPSEADPTRKKEAVEDAKSLDHFWSLLQEARTEQLAELKAGEFSRAMSDEQKIGEYLRLHQTYASHFHMLLVSGDLGNEDRVKTLIRAVKIVYQKEQIEQDLSDEILKFDFGGRPAVLVEDFENSRTKIDTLNALTDSVLAFWK